MARAFVAAASLCVGAAAWPLRGATYWNWEWTPAADETAPAATVCHLKYGKRWAYTVEIDDAPSSTLAAATLFAGYKYTDAPPGVAGGTQRPFVGSAAVHVIRVGANSTYLSFADLRTLQTAGWAVANHSYAHSGYGWAPEGLLTPTQIREDHFWSQTLLAQEVGDGRAPSHFVYPNGWTGYHGAAANDYTYFDESGFRSATRLGASGGRNLFAGARNVRDFDRVVLDGLGTANPLTSLPAPAVDDLQVDFTHQIDPTAGSDNRQAWTARLAYIAANWGAAGADDVWSAPSAEVFDYAASAQSATVAITRGRVCLTLPDAAPGTALTLKLTGIPTGSVIAAPPGGLVYRQGTTVWLTTPHLGARGADAPFPRVRRLYQGTVQNQNFASAQSVAGVQIYQLGTAPNPFRVDLTAAGGAVNFATSTTLGSNWGDRKLFSQVPAQPAANLPLSTALQVTTNGALAEMSIWVIDDTVRRRTEWRSDVFSAGEISAGAADDLADLDGDGLSNLAEYALGTNARVADAALAPQVSIVGGRLALTFPRDTRHPDVVIAVEASSDPSDPTRWTRIATSARGAPTIANGAWSVTETGNGAIKTVTVTDPLLVDGSSRRFLRLRLLP